MDRRSWPAREPRPREGDQAGGQREVACKGGVCSHFTGEKTEAPGGHRTPMRPHSAGEELSLGPNQATPPPPATCWAGSHAPGWRRHFRVDGLPLRPAPFSAPAPASPQTFRGSTALSLDLLKRDVFKQSASFSAPRQWLRPKPLIIPSSRQRPQGQSKSRSPSPRSSQWPHRDLHVLPPSTPQ